ncbi:MAG TPA: 30S ribosome-binding factor RbfA [Rhodospirillales bacterium]|jgi:ribosome-binding factor A|nr:30S ribosome-binding factor RbfA [Rhodospirillales bacterium]HJO68993.1 30S ribosome-binding factor RbfA [Rhodospirillales bacterium]
MSKRTGRPPSQRQLRVGEEIRHVLAELMERRRLRDRALDGHSITVTEARVSADLRSADVFVIPLGGGDGAVILNALARAKPFLRREIARSVRLKFVPELRFHEDQTFDAARRIEELLHPVDGEAKAHES